MYVSLSCLPALLIYNKLTDNLTSEGFKLNFYDGCFTNKMVKGNRMSLCWHVDGLKISHMDKREVIKMIALIKGKYGKMRITRGKYHDYLGMDLDFFTPKQVLVRMEKYLMDTTKEFPQVVVVVATSPAAE